MAIPTSTFLVTCELILNVGRRFDSFTVSGIDPNSDVMQEDLIAAVTPAVNLLLADNDWVLKEILLKDWKTISTP
jgi:hypothetical protein